LRKVRDAFKAAPVMNPDQTTGYNVHFDVGPGYAGYADPDWASYLVPSDPRLARGGETIKENACVGAHCQFPDYPGTVSFQIGYQFLRDAPVGMNGEELSAAGENACFDQHC